MEKGEREGKGVEEKERIRLEGKCNDGQGKAKKGGKSKNIEKRGRETKRKEVEELAFMRQCTEK